MPAVSLGCLVKGVATYSSSATSFRFPAAFLRRPTISHRCFFNAGLTYLLTEASLRLRAGFLEKSAFSRKCLWAEVQAHILLAIRFRLAADFLQRRSAHGPFRNHFHTHVGPCDPPSGREPPAALQERVLKKSKPAVAVAFFAAPKLTQLEVHCDASQLGRFGTAGRSSPSGIEGFVTSCRQKANRRLVRFMPAVRESSGARLVWALHAALKRFVFVELNEAGNVLLKQSPEVEVVDGSPQPSLPRRRVRGDHFGGDVEAGVTPV